MAVRSDCNLIIRRRWSVEDSEDKIALTELESLWGSAEPVRGRQLMMTMPVTVGTVPVSMIATIVWVATRVLDMEGWNMSTGEGIE